MNGSTLERNQSFAIREYKLKNKINNEYKKTNSNNIIRIEMFGSCKSLFNLIYVQLNPKEFDLYIHFHKNHFP